MVILQLLDVLSNNQATMANAKPLAGCLCTDSPLITAIVETINSVAIFTVTWQVLTDK